MRSVSRRGVLTGATAFAGSLLLPGVGTAQTYPTKPVRVIVPYAPGGGTDTITRLLTAHIRSEFGQSLVVDNRGGGASQIGTLAISTAAPDGYTFGMIDSAFFSNPGLFRGRLPYDTKRDFIPISLLARTQLVLCVPATSPFKTAAELVAHLKANPGKMSFASSGLGTAPHLAGEQFLQATGTKFEMIQYRGAGPALLEFLGGVTDFSFFSVPTIKPHIESGKVRGLAVTRGRAPQFPDIASMDEAGLSTVDSASEMGLVAPKSTPADVSAKLAELSARAVKSPELSARMLELGFLPIGNTPDEFRAYIDTEIVKWTRVIEIGNVQPE